MIIRRLEFCGIGPFGGEHVIDFDQLTESGIFLLDGPTGSGKSSIIDAIVFALYGDVAGKESSQERIRSTHTPPNTESWVDLVFSVASGTYRVRRTPQWERPKKNGSGTTKVNQSATLWKLSESAVDEQAWDSGEPISTQAREVGIELRAILALDKKQFAQTVVLPQGQFADFLRLKSSEREPLLETIFDTSNYRLFADTLKRQASDLEKQVQQAAQTYRQALSTWLEISDLSDDIRQQLRSLEESALAFDVPSDPQCDADLLAFVADTVAVFADQAAQRTEEALAAQGTEETARAAFEETLKVLEAIAEHKSAAQQLNELDKQQNVRNQNQVALEAHQEARPLAQQLDEADEAREQLKFVYEQAADALDPAYFASVESQFETWLASDSDDDVTQNVPDFDFSAILSELEERRARLSETIGSLQGLAAEEAEIEQRRAELHQRKAERDECAAMITEITESRTKLPAEIARIIAELAAAQTLQADLGSLEAQRTQLSQQGKLFAQHAVLTEKISAHETVVGDLFDKHRKAKEHFDLLTNQWIASTAANLAEQLVEGAPCPVCGSCEHPHRAEPSPTHTTREQVDLAQNALQAATNDLDEANTELTKLKAQLSATAADLGDVTREELQNRQGELDTQYADAQKAVHTAQTLSTRLEAKREESEDLAEKLAAAQSQHAELKTACELETIALAKDATRLATARAGFTSVREHIESLQKAQANTREQVKYIDSLSEAAHTLHSILLKIVAGIAASSFPSAVAVREAILTEDSVTQLRRAIRAHDDALSALKAKLAEPRFANLPDESTIDLNRFEAELAKAKEARSEADTRAAHAQRFASDTQRLSLPLQTASAAWHKLAAEAGPVLRLADIAQAGRSSRTRVPLSMWVLLKRFEMVVDRANEHLAQISGGRYELRRSNEGNRIQKTGLGLSIIDRDGSPQGDVERSTASLSGGETFYTSLALALALAEVVQEENGGIRIDTLIIDEGFGTLSDDVRDAVMKTLSTLTAHGRKVGIVSHVEELKQMIPNRISITPSAHGGSDLTVTA
ncbi:AAA family ATPase [Arcanobacterium bovis]|uniref:Nuclease SbcCD subunit C n=1 Tax=Arcanobacterium bovis TaxID=2529275 RepID=A0A4Q9UZS4_9ACTO|nr:SMC family ATPase [Arcanobacterium bovis]TBW21535.1 SMC family ATPase [Arcanobacterium bovis]